RPGEPPAVAERQHEDAVRDRRRGERARDGGPARLHGSLERHALESREPHGTEATLGARDPPLPLARVDADDLHGWSSAAGRATAVVSGSAPSSSARVSSTARGSRAPGQPSLHVVPSKTRAANARTPGRSGSPAASAAPAGRGTLGRSARTSVPVARPPPSGTTRYVTVWRSVLGRAAAGGGFTVAASESVDHGS